MLKIAICDDENYVCSQVEKILIEISKTLTKKIEIDIFYSGETLYQFLSDGANFDVIFLDIELQILSGVEIGKKIRDELHNEITQIIYISAKDSYAMDLFNIRPLNFLIKPLQKEKIAQVVRKAIELLDRGDHFFEYKLGRTKNKVYIKDILYFESDGKKVKIVLKDQEHEFYSKLPDVEHQLENQDFIYIHKSYLVNYYHVIQYQYDFVKMSNKTILPISQQQRKSVRYKLLQYTERCK